jgi:hypothetical protein
MDGVDAWPCQHQAPPLGLTRATSDVTLLACQAQSHRVFEDDEVYEARAKEDFCGADGHAGANAEADGINEHRLCEGPLGELLDSLPPRLEVNPPVRAC